LSRRGNCVRAGPMKDRKTLLPLDKRIAESAPITIKLREGGIPANLRPMEYRPPVVTLVPATSTNTAIKAGWICLALGFGLACIPGVGLLIFLIGLAPIGIAFLMGVVGMATGRIAAGIFLCLASVTLAPVAYLLVPLLTGQFIQR
jgi:hypothetical protein